jgi:multidrug efflux pump subunit AcrA (membrane-fusion protein)
MPLFWLLSCWGGLISAVFLCAGLALHYQVTPKIILKGSVIADDRLDPLILPAGLPVGTILVEDGDHLAQGDPVLRYDESAIEAQIEILQQSLTDVQLQITCLRDPETILIPDESQPAAPLHTDTTPPLSKGDENSHAQENCRLRHQRDHLERAKLHSEIQTSQSNLALFQKHMRSPSSAPLTSSDITAALRTSLQEQQLSREITQLKIALAALVADQKSASISEAETLEAKHAVLAEALKVQQSILSDPFLRTHSAGQLLRLRVPRTGHRMTDDTVIAQIRLKTDRYTARANLPAEWADSFQPGDRAELRLSGLPVNAPMLPARLETVTPQAGALVPEGALQITLNLQPDNITDARWRYQVGRHLEFLNGAALAEISLPPQSVFTHLRRSLLSERLTETIFR